MAFIDVVEWSPRDNKTFAYRFPNTNLSTATQLIVRESQEAVFFSKGQILGVFGPGKHQLTTENLPLLRSLYGIPFGGRNPFTAEVWFVNKAMPLNNDWKTTQMRIMDPEYKTMIPIVAMGRYGIQVQDAVKFLVKLNGTMSSFTEENITDYFKGPLIAKMNSAIVSYMSTNQVGIMQIAAYLDNLSTFVKEPLREFWEPYGLRLIEFYVTSIDVDTSSREGKQISDALVERSTQNIVGYTWQQRQSFDVANNAFSGGGGMGLMGMALMTGGLSRGGGADIASAMMQQPQSTGFGATPGYGQQGYGPQGYGAQQGYGGPQGAGAAPQGYQVHARAQVFCANCGKPFDANSRFCPNCGHEYHPCPMCGADNMESARRCVSCGASLQQGMSNADFGTTCSRCGAQVKPGTKFCPHCGNRIG